MHTRFAACGIGLGAALLAAPAAGAGQQIETRTFFFAQVGTSYTGAIFASDPIVGKKAIGARITLNVFSPPGSDAQFFSTDLLLPIIPHPGKTGLVAFDGESLGWSGEGTFELFIETDDIQGEFISTLFGAETPGGGGFFGEILEGSMVEVDYIVPAPASVGVAMCGLVALRRRRR